MSARDDVLAAGLTARGGPAERLEHALGAAAGRLGVERCRLYVRDDTAGRYRLVGGWLSATASDVGADPGRAGVDGPPVPTVLHGDEGPTLELSGAPPQELVTVPTPEGPMLPLRLAVEGQLDAVLLMSPRGRRLPMSARRYMDEVRAALAAVVTALLRETALEHDLAAATARVETGRRLRDSALSPDRFLRLLLDLAVRGTSSEGGFVAVSDPEGRLAVRVSEGVAQSADELDVTPETGVFDWSLADTGALLVRDPDQVTRAGIRSMLAVPLLGDGDPLGVVALTTHTRAAAFTEHSLQLLGVLSEQVGLMLENERVFAEFTGRYFQALHGVARTLDARRPETAGYHERVGALAAVLADASALRRDEVEAVRQAALVHDVGLAAVPGAQRAFLSDVEHPAVGASLVEGLPVHPGIAPAIATHHEWYDGWGFPDGLRGDDIPVGGRVLGLAAFCVEMSSADLVRPAWDADRVLEEVRRRAGSQFDPALVEAGHAALAAELTERDG
ncbi:MAG: GAF domain-containing protein [Actinomycetota bacterium]|nr:GAF domain-containing protein [Actinomycetota bacterium]